MDLSEAISFRRDGWIVEEKFDGIRCVVNLCGSPMATGRIFSEGRMKPLRSQTVAQGWHPRLAGTVFDGELLADGGFHVFDLLVFDGQDLRQRPLRERKRWLNSVADWVPGHASTVRSFPDVSAMGSFGEGVVWKRLGAPYGHDWFKAKRRVTVDCVVARVWPNGVAETVGRGKIVDCPPDLKAGQIVECIALKVFASGALRNGWFLRLRDDKAAQTAPAPS